MRIEQSFSITPSSVSLESTKSSSYPLLRSVFSLLSVPASRKEKIIYSIGAVVLSLGVLYLVAHMFRSILGKGGPTFQGEVYRSTANAANPYDLQGVIPIACRNLPSHPSIRRIFIVECREGSAQILFDDDAPFKYFKEIFIENPEEALIIYAAIDEKASQTISSSLEKGISQQDALRRVGKSRMRSIFLTYEEVNKMTEAAALAHFYKDEEYKEVMFPRRVLEEFKRFP
ncbi:MAG: hypothetical protein JSR58_06710 [Verrucomicrobia bacterium]|nr:hypothetical protein [Verrucomicrobiota bacterium]